MNSMLAGLFSSVMDHIESSAPLDIIDLTGDSPVSSLRNSRRRMPSRNGSTTRQHGSSALRPSIMEIPSSSQTNNGHNMIEILDDAINSWDMWENFNILHSSHPSFTNNHITAVPRTRRQQTTRTRSHTQRQLPQQENNGSIATNNPVVDVAPCINDTMQEKPVPIICPICFETLSSARKPMSTRCGHIFCAECLRSSLSSSNKCPKCKNKIVKNSCIRLYF